MLGFLAKISACRQQLSLQDLSQENSLGGVLMPNFVILMQLLPEVITSCQGLLVLELAYISVLMSQ
jgi:hypothetical protein